MSKVCESCGRNRPERFGLSDHPDGSRAGSLSFPKRSMAVTAKLIPLRAQNSSWMGRLQESTFTAIRFRAEAMSTGEVCEAYTLYLTSFPHRLSTDGDHRSTYVCASRLLCKFPGRSGGILSWLLQADGSAGKG